jgi:transposase-like protein
MTKERSDHRRKLTAEKARAIRERHALGESVEDLAKVYGVSEEALKDVLRYLTWAFAGPKSPLD